MAESHGSCTYHTEESGYSPTPGYMEGSCISPSTCCAPGSHYIPTNDSFNLPTEGYTAESNDIPSDSAEESDSSAKTSDTSESSDSASDSDTAGPKTLPSDNTTEPEGLPKTYHAAGAKYSSKSGYVRKLKGAPTPYHAVESGDSSSTRRTARSDHLHTPGYTAESYGAPTTYHAEESGDSVPACTTCLNNVPTTDSTTEADNPPAYNRKESNRAPKTDYTAESYDSATARSAVESLSSPPTGSSAESYDSPPSAFMVESYDSPVPDYSGESAGALPCCTGWSDGSGSCCTAGSHYIPESGYTDSPRPGYMPESCKSPSTCCAPGSHYIPPAGYTPESNYSPTCCAPGSHYLPTLGYTESQNPQSSWQAAESGGSRGICNICASKSRAINLNNTPSTESDGSPKTSNAGEIEGLPLKCQTIVDPKKCCCPCAFGPELDIVLSKVFTRRLIIHIKRPIFPFKFM